LPVQPICFLSFTARRANITSPTLWRNENTSSFPRACICADENAVPCSATEVFNSKEHWEKELLESGICPKKHEAMFAGAKDAKARLMALPDSVEFIGLSNMKRMHCPLPASATEKKYTFTHFSSLESMEEYCEKGHDYAKKHQQFQFDKFDFKCKKATSKVKDDAETRECRHLCNHLQQKCEGSDTMSDCVNIAVKSDIPTGASQMFSKCDIPEVPAFGNGLIFCKCLF
ncbi:microneme protein MIC15, partial [Cardiosporidium cionae]